MKIKLTIAVLCICAMAQAGFGAVEQTVNELIPKLAATRVEDRNGPQMELQKLAVNAARPGAESERSRLAKYLALKAADAAVPQPARVWIVRQLEYIGAAESVVALTGLLSGADAELRECARRALEKNPVPAATTSLRAALQQGGDAAWKAGLINSLGERRDGAAVALIAPALNDPQLAAAAASALGKIANDDAVKALWTAFDQKSAVAADALLAAADQISVRRSTRAAGDIWLRLYAVTNALPVRCAALNGLAKAHSSDAKKFIPEALASPEPRLQGAAVTAAQTFYGKAFSRVLAEFLPGLNPLGKVIVLQAMDSTAERHIVARTSDTNEVVRIAALQRLGEVGIAANVPVLVKAASGANPAEAKAAAGALATISGKGVDAAIARLAEEGEAKSRSVAIVALGARGNIASAPALLKYAGEPDEVVSRAACAALGRVGTENEIEGLARLVIAGNVPGADEALQNVARRAKNKPLAAKKLISATRAAPPEKLVPMIGALGALGGDDALAVVAGYASSSNEELKNSAIRALCSWPDFAATRPLLAIAADANTSPVHRVLAIQGIVRLVKSSENVPPAARLDAALGAMIAASRDEEKRLAISAIATVPHAKSAEALKVLFFDRNLKVEAGQAAITLANTLLATDKATARDLARAIKTAGISDDLVKKADEILSK